MNVKEQNVLVVGTGISGIGAANLLVKQGARVTLYDQNEKLREEDVRAKLPDGMEADIVIGEMPGKSSEKHCTSRNQSRCSHRFSFGGGM